MLTGAVRLHFSNFCCIHGSDAAVDLEVSRVLRGADSSEYTPLNTMYHDQFSSAKF